MRSIGVGIASCWVALLACGGVTQRHVDNDDENGGSSASGTSHASRSGASSSSTAGAVAAAGSTNAAAGTSAMIPMPPTAPAPCFHDTDCPGSACGGQVCNWTLAHPQPDGAKVFVCNPAGSQPKGVDGWCTTDANCKCANLGAKCGAPYCTFTR